MAGGLGCGWLLWLRLLAGGWLWLWLVACGCGWRLVAVVGGRLVTVACGCGFLARTRKLGFSPFSAIRQNATCGGGGPIIHHQGWDGGTVVHFGVSLGIAQDPLGTTPLAVKTGYVLFIVFYHAGGSPAKSLNIKKRPQGTRGVVRW